jgi:hypothetical protein
VAIAPSVATPSAAGGGVRSHAASPAVKTPLTEQEKEDNLSWLSNLQQQMGALKQQVNVMQQNSNNSNNNMRSPPIIAVPASSASPVPAAGAAAAAAAVGPRISVPAAGGAPAGKNYAIKRQSFPVDDRRQQAAAVKAAVNAALTPSGLDAPRSVASVASSVSSSASSAVSAGAKKKAAAGGGGGGGRLSDPKGGGGVVVKRPHIAAPSPPVSVSPVPAVDLDQRRELREKHKMGFRDFLKQQRGVGVGVGSGSVSGGGSLTTDDDSVSVASSERSTPVLYAPPASAVVAYGDLASPPPIYGGYMVSPPPVGVSASLQQTTSSAASAGSAAGSVASSHRSRGGGGGGSSKGGDSSVSLRKFIEDQRRQHRASPHVPTGTDGSAGATAATAAAATEVQIFESAHRYTPPPPSSSSSANVAVVAASSRNNEWVQEEMFTYVKAPATLHDHDHDHDQNYAADRQSLYRPVAQHATPSPARGTPTVAEAAGARTPVADNNDGDDNDDDERPTDPQVRPSGWLTSAVAHKPSVPMTATSVRQGQYSPMRGRNMADEFLDDDDDAADGADDADADATSDFLGKSFVLQMQDADLQEHRRRLDAQAALEYSQMLQQMQEILQLGAGRAHELDAANYDDPPSSSSSAAMAAGAAKRVVGPPSSLSIIREDAAAEATTAAAAEGEDQEEEEEIEEGFEEASFTFYLSDSDDEHGHGHGHGRRTRDGDHNYDVDDEDVNEYGEEYLKEIADRAEEDEDGDTEDVVAATAIVEEVSEVSEAAAAAAAVAVAGRGAPMGDSVEPLFRRTDPAVFAQLGRPPKQPLSAAAMAAAAAAEAAAAAMEGDLVEEDLDGGNHNGNDRSATTMRRCTPGHSDPFQDTTRNFTASQPPPATPPTAAAEAGLSAEGDALLRTTMSRTQKQRIQQKLEALLGPERLARGLQFLSSTYLEDETADEEYLLTMLEEIVGTEHLYCLEDMYYLLSL